MIFAIVRSSFPSFMEVEEEDYLSTGSCQKKVGAEGLRCQHGQHGLCFNDKKGDGFIIRGRQ